MKKHKMAKIHKKIHKRIGSIMKYQNALINKNYKLSK